MSHYSAEKSRTASTPPAWLKVGANLNDLVNEWASRGDIVTYVGDGAGSGAPACFKPLIAEMEVDRTLAFGEGIEPRWIGDLTSRAAQFDHPVAMGAVLHEAMHARHSTWDIMELAKHKDRIVGKIAELFEETRIEKRGVAHYPRNRSFLRACAMKLILGDMKDEDDEITGKGTFALSQLMLLTCARVDADVLEDEDVAFVKDRAEGYLGHDLYEKLRRIWCKAQAHSKDTEFKPLVKLAEEWCKLLKDEGHDMHEEAKEAAEANEALASILGEIMGEMGEAAESTETEARAEGAVMEEREWAEEAAAERASENAEEREHKETSSKIFAKSTGPSADTRTDSTLVKTRAPKDTERAAAVTVARLLDQARYRDRVTEVKAGRIPPGKLRSRAAVQGAVERARGQIMTAEPWKRKRRFHVEDPTLKVGVLVDISGSMGGAMEPMAVTSWMLSEACRRIQAESGMVYFGNGVFPVLKPGQHLKDVNVYSAPDGTERFSLAFEAIDGALNLLHGSGARLLVICSDICYMRGSEAQHVKKWVNRCTAAGVGVLVLTYDEGGHAKMNLGDTQAKIITGSLDPANAAVLIGKTAAAALENAGLRR